MERRLRPDAPVVAPAKVPLAERKNASNMCALAVLGGRFGGNVKEALMDPQFSSATRHYVDVALAEMRKQPAAVAAATVAEAARLTELEEAAAAERTDSLDMKRSSDIEYVQAAFSEKLLVAAEAGTEFSKSEVASWAALFETSDAETLWDMSYRFQYACWAGIVARAKKQPRGAKAVKEQAVVLFCEKAAWSERAIKDAVSACDEAHIDRRGRPRSYPADLEEELLYFCKQLRRCKARVTKDTVLDHAMRLLGPHEASLNFALVGSDGEYVRNEELGGFEWDDAKLDNWYYRRFLADHPELSTGVAVDGWVVVSRGRRDFMYRNRWLFSFTLNSHH